jgi:hypothetical protein
VDPVGREDRADLRRLGGVTDQRRALRTGSRGGGHHGRADAGAGPGDDEPPSGEARPRRAHAAGAP